MCGGRGTRLDAAVEKPLYEVGGVPMVDRVADALAKSRIETTYAIVSPHTPATHAHLEDDLPVVETAGEGYVSDLATAMEQVTEPALTVVADLPLLSSDAVDHVIDAVARVTPDGGGTATVVVPRALKRELGMSTDYDRAWVPAGLNVVADGEDTLVRSWDARLAVNVNRKRDATAAERLLVSDGL